jgi:hypothetical protein
MPLTDVRYKGYVISLVLARTSHYTAVQKPDGSFVMESFKNDKTAKEWIDKNPWEETEMIDVASVWVVYAPTEDTVCGYNVVANNDVEAISKFNEYRNNNSQFARRVGKGHRAYKLEILVK